MPPRLRGQQQPQYSFLWVDKSLGVFGCALIPFQLASRWQHYDSAEKGGFLLAFLLYITVLIIIPWRLPQFYAKHRSLLLLLSKGVLVSLPITRRGVRLSQPATHNWVADLTCAALGLRIFGLFMIGLVPLPGSVWFLQQLACIAAVLNLEQDCKTELMTHPLMAQRIAQFHYTMELLAEPLLPQTSRLVIKTQEGQCKAAVSFAAVVGCVLLPALCLTRGERPEEREEMGGPQEPEMYSPLRRLDRLSEDMMRMLCYRFGLLEQVLTFWQLLVLIWAGCAVAF